MKALPPQRLNVNYLMIHVNRTLTNLHNYCKGPFLYYVCYSEYPFKQSSKHFISKY